MDRRSFLVLGAATLTLAACTSSPDPDPDPDHPTPSTPADDDRLRDTVATAEVALIGAYRAALAQAPDLAAELTPFLEHHLAHLERVSPGDDRGTATASSSPPAASTEPAGPADVAGLLEALAGAETTARKARIADCDAADSGQLAHDLAQIAASEAQHAAHLEALITKVRS